MNWRQGRVSIHQFYEKYYVFGVYIEGNVQWVHKDVNVMKWDLTIERFLDLVGKINQTRNGA